MTSVIAGLALFIAFISVWLASTNLKKMEEGNRLLEEKLTAKIEKLGAEVDKKFSKIDKQVGTLNDKIKPIIQASGIAWQQLKDSGGT